MQLACCLPKLHFLFFPEKKPPRIPGCFRGKVPKPETHQRRTSTHKPPPEPPKRSQASRDKLVSISSVCGICCSLPKRNDSFTASYI